MRYEKEHLSQIAFPLGGIGTGCVSLLGNGELNDWEIFNRPNKNTRNGYSHFAIKATRGGKRIAKVLHGDPCESLSGSFCKSDGGYGYGHGVREQSMAGFSHFQSVTFEGAYPFANLTFSDEEFPATVRLCAFNPFIPHDEFNSSLPAAFFEWEIENVTDEPIEFSLAFSARNPAKNTQNRAVSSGAFCGIQFCESRQKDTEIGYCDLCVLTDAADVDVQEYWYRGAWKDGITTFWKNFADLDRLPARSYDTDAPCDYYGILPSGEDHGTVASYVTVAPHARARVRFILAWNVPIAYNDYWKNSPEDKNEDFSWRNYYATQFASSLATAQYAMEHYTDLYEKTRLFSDAIWNSSLPEAVKDAISANLSIIKTPTALRLTDGTFWGWEGCNETSGSCPGSCQHVYNYAYVLPYLFPRLERSMRDLTLNYALKDSGETSFRIKLPPEKSIGTGTRCACVDGQMGEVIKCYREWKFSGDDAWLATRAQKIFSMLEFAWSPENPHKWDFDCDGVLEGRQHHTLDLEFFGPSSWLQGYYLLALDCGAQMARHLGDTARAARYTALYERGKAWTNEHLFNGKYFHQAIDLTDKSLLDRFDAAQLYWNDEAKQIKYQLGYGCLCEQMVADWHAALIGTAPVFDADKKHTALQNLYRNNYKTSMRQINNMWRIFATGDESATVLCTFPDAASTPAHPLLYCEETFGGFEYALAGLLLANGFIAEGEQMVTTLRARYNGANRNPFNEMECGSHYARNMASFALLPLYSGFTFDMVKKHVGFAPLMGTGSFLFSVADSWGMAELTQAQFTLRILGNPLTLSSVATPSTSVREVLVDGVACPFTVEGNTVRMGEVRIKKELTLLY